MVLKNSSSLVGMNLMIMSLFAAVILMYFTFEFVYSFLISSEIIFKNATSNSELSTDVNKNTSRLETDTKTHIDKENTSKNERKKLWPLNKVVVRLKFTKFHQVSNSSFCPLASLFYHNHRN